MHSLLGPSVTDAADSRLGLMSSASHLPLRPGELGAVLSCTQEGLAVAADARPRLPFTLLFLWLQRA